LNLHVLLAHIRISTWKLTRLFFREAKNYYQIILERDSTDIVSQSAGSTLREDLAAQTEEKEDKKLSLDLKSKAGRLRDILFSGFRIVWCAEASGGGTVNA